MKLAPVLKSRADEEDIFRVQALSLEKLFVNCHSDAVIVVSFL